MRSQASFETTVRDIAVTSAAAAATATAAVAAAVAVERERGMAALAAQNKTGWKERGWSSAAGWPSRPAEASPDEWLAFSYLAFFGDSLAFSFSFSLPHNYKNKNRSWLLRRYL